MENQEVIDVQEKIHDIITSHATQVMLDNDDAEYRIHDDVYQELLNDLTVLAIKRP